MKRAAALAAGTAFAMSSCSYCDQDDIPCLIEQSNNSISIEMLLGYVMAGVGVLVVLATVRRIQKTMLLARRSTKRLISELEADGWVVKISRVDDSGFVAPFFRIFPTWGFFVSNPSSCPKHYRPPGAMTYERSYEVATGTWKDLKEKDRPDDIPRNCPDCQKALARSETPLPGV